MSAFPGIKLMVFTEHIVDEEIAKILPDKSINMPFLSEHDTIYV
jgi:hypothetical protein